MGDSARAGFSVLALLLAMASGAPQRERTSESALAGVESLTPDSAYEKYPSLAFDLRGTLWCARTRTLAGRDSIVVSRRDDSGWSPAERIDRGEGFESGAAAATVGDSVWVFWHGRRQGRWSVYGRERNAAGWNPERRLSDDSVDALHPVSAVDRQGRVWLAWEVAKPGGFRIQAAVLEFGQLSPPAEIDSSGSERRPWLAAAPSGRVFLAWDSTRSGNYDVWWTELRLAGGTPRFDPPQPVTWDAAIDDSPSLAAASDGTLWLAWNSMRSKKGEALRTDRHSGDAFVRVFRDGRWLAPPGVVKDALPGQVSWGAVNKTPRDAVDPYWHWKQTQNYPRVFADRRDRAWVVWRTDATGAHNFDLWARVHDGKAWSRELHLTDFSPGRDEWPAAAASPDGTLQLAWEGQVLPQGEGDQALLGGDVDAYNTLANPNVVLTGRLASPAEGWRPAPLSPAPAEVFKAEEVNEPPAPGPPPGAARSGQWNVFFGDPHMHSILSDGKTGLPDQLLALSRDWLGLDFAVVSDHSEMGILQPSEYAELQLAAGVFNQPGRFVSLTGWEWTAGTRFGHRVALHEDEGGPPLSSALPEGDTIEKLYAHLRRHGGVVSPHHTGNATWGRWNPDARHDEELEPNFEIASWHGRFEFYGNPREGRRQVPGHQYQDALRRGRRVGVMAASDTHHLSPGEGGLTAVLAERLDRASIFDAIRSRRCYATTGPRIVLEFSVNGLPMGSVVETEGPLDMEVSVSGTAPVDRIEIVRGLIDAFAAVRIEQSPEQSEGVFLIYEPSNPTGGRRLSVEDTRQVTFRTQDADLRQGEISYYVRVTQQDGHQAWSSPIWVTQASR